MAFEPRISECVLTDLPKSPDSGMPQFIVVNRIQFLKHLSIAFFFFYRPTCRSVDEKRHVCSLLPGKAGSCLRLLCAYRVVTKEPVAPKPNSEVTLFRFQASKNT